MCGVSKGSVPAGLMVSSSGTPGLLGVADDEDEAVTGRPGRKDMVAITDDFFVLNNHKDKV